MAKKKSDFEKSVISLGKHWQKLLNLSHWDIKFEAVEAADMSNQNAIGECWHHETDRRAIISIRATPDWGDLGPFYTFCPEDVEKCIIHELLHIVLQDVSVRSLKRDVERTNNHLTDVIYTLAKR